MQTKIILFAIYACWLFSCNNQPNIREGQFGEAEYVISVLPKKDMLPFDLKPYLDTVKYVKLELTDESIIGSMDKIIVYEDQIYILDRQTACLFVFGMDGRYLHKIDRGGQGPEEYTQLDFFDIDRENKHLVLTDLMAYWIIRYDFDGNFLFKQKIPFWCESVSVLPNNGLALYANFRDNSENLKQEYNLIFLDSAMQVKQFFFPYHSSDFRGKRPPTSTSGQFYAFENHLNFFFPRGNTIYRIAGDSLVNAYLFDFGKNILSVENTSNPDLFIERLSKNDFNGFVGTVMENEKLLLFSMCTDVGIPILYTVYYSKESGNILSAYSFTVDGVPFSGHLQTCYDSWIISEIPTSSFLDWKDAFLKQKTATTNNYVKAKFAFAEGLSKDDNSVLMFYKLNF